MGNGRIYGPVFFDGNVMARAIYRWSTMKWWQGFNSMFNFSRMERFQDWWSQDGAPAHQTRLVRDRLEQLCPRRVIGIGHQVEWPPRSSDLTPCDYFLWGYLKARVYRTPPVYVQDLERRIRAELTALRRNHAMIRRAVRHMMIRAQRCLDADGGHVESRVAWNFTKISHRGLTDFWFFTRKRMTQWLFRSSDKCWQCAIRKIICALLILQSLLFLLQSLLFLYFKHPWKKDMHKDFTGQKIQKR